MTQGDTVSPTTFNVVIDAVVRTWLWETDRLDFELNDIRSNFHADDGRNGSCDAELLQESTDVMVDPFKRLGLCTDVTKTKVMTSVALPPPGRQSTPAFKQRIAGEGKWRALFVRKACREDPFGSPH